MTAVAHVEGFYRWYLRRAAAESAFPNRPADADSLSRFITPELKAAYPRIAEDTEADAFLAAQDTFEEWTDAVEARSVQRTADGEIVLVSFGPPPTPPHQVAVQVRRVGDGWRIAAVRLYEAPAAAARH